jgi:hypothetical protein
MPMGLVNQMKKLLSESTDQDMQIDSSSQPKLPNKSAPKQINSLLQ